MACAPVKKDDKKAKAAKGAKTSKAPFFKPGSKETMSKKKTAKK